MYMDDPKTRREKKKDPRDKKSDKYSSKHVRQLESRISGKRI